MKSSYKERILRVNLTEHTFSEEPLSNELIHDYIGGRGFGIKLLYDELKPGTGALSEENILIFVAGPLAGANAQSFARWKVFFKSPLTGTYFKSSGGGNFASELKFAGFDAIIIKGIADRPVYLWINDGRYQLRDATYLQGLDCEDTHSLIREELHDPNIRIACIGPAGEYGVKYAGIFSDRHAAGRGGGGTVMGAKNLKAVAVRGRGKVNLADPEAFRAGVQEQVNAYRTHPDFENFSKRGTQATLELINYLGMLPSRNFREGTLPNWENLSYSKFDELRVGKRTCYRCMLHCGNLIKVDTGKYRGSWSQGPEFETIWGFSSPIMTADIGLTVAADKLCDDLGLDTISTANTIGFAYELYEQGLITKADTDGLELTYGKGEPVLTLIRQIAYREGIGNLLAQGVQETAYRIGKGSDEYAMHVKGLELPGYDPRGAKAHGLNLMTMNIGADHNSGYSHQELRGTSYKGKQVDRFAVEDKGEICKYNQDITAVYETGILCVFAVRYLNDLRLYGSLLSAATGVQDFADPDYLTLVGERIYNLERMFNVREGFDRKDDVLPTRITGEVLQSGPSAGKIFEAELLLDDYYRVRGWDVKTGIPTTAKLNELGLGFCQTLI